MSKYHNDFIVDRLTNSIINVNSGESHKTEIALLLKEDLKLLNIEKRWLFNWHEEYISQDRKVYKLIIASKNNVLQGLTSLSMKNDHVFIHLIENSPFNKGKHKLYEGVAGNLVAYACKLSFQNGNEGFVSFHSKSKLIDHYIETLNAKHYGNQLMVIDTHAAIKLVDKYFKS